MLNLQLVKKTFLIFLSRQTDSSIIITACMYVYVIEQEHKHKSVVILQQAFMPLGLAKMIYQKKLTIDNSKQATFAEKCRYRCFFLNKLLFSQVFLRMNSKFWDNCC